MEKVKINLSLVEFNDFVQMLLRIDQCHYGNAFEKQIIKLVLKKLVLKLLPRQFTLNVLKNAVMLSASEAVCINKVLFQLPSDDFQQALAVMVESKIRPLCSLNI